MTDSFDPVAYNREAWDREVDAGNEWTRPVEPEIIAQARAGDWSVVLIGTQPVPRAWFPDELTGVDVLCLASGGGQQGPVLSAAGARVTVLDNSPRQLGRDRDVADRENLALRTELGDMRDLTMFADVVSTSYSTPCPPSSALTLLRSGGNASGYYVGGILMSGFLNPDVFIFDVAAMEDRDELIVRHQLPFSTLDLSDDERQRVYGTGPIEYSHSMSAQLGGQLAAGFRLTDLDEAPHQADATARYMSGYFATRAVKP